MAPSYFQPKPVFRGFLIRKVVLSTIINKISQGEISAKKGFEQRSILEAQEINFVFIAADAGIQNCLNAASDSEGVDSDAEEAKEAVQDGLEDVVPRAADEDRGEARGEGLHAVLEARRRHSDARGLFGKPEQDLKR